MSCEIELKAQNGTKLTDVEIFAYITNQTDDRMSVEVDIVLPPILVLKDPPGTRTAVIAPRNTEVVAWACRYREIKKGESDEITVTGTASWDGVFVTIAKSRSLSQLLHESVNFKV